MNGGDTFYLRGPESLSPHLWVIVSDPHQDCEKVVVVSMTTYRDGKDPACRLAPGDHPNIDHDTCMHYPKPQLLTCAKIEKAAEIGALEWQEPVNQMVLERIRKGAVESRFIPIKFLQILLDQDLGDP